MSEQSIWWLRTLNRWRMKNEVCMCVCVCFMTEIGSDITSSQQMYYICLLLCFCFVLCSHWSSASQMLTCQTIPRQNLPFPLLFVLLPPSTHHHHHPMCTCKQSIMCTSCAHLKCCWQFDVNQNYFCKSSSHNNWFFSSFVWILDASCYSEVNLSSVIFRIQIVSNWENSTWK